MSPELIDWGSKALALALVTYYFRSQKENAAESEKHANEQREALRTELRNGLAELKDIIKDMRGELRSLADTDKQQGREILEGNIRIRQLESQVGRFETWKDDLTRFMQSLGFKKRDGGGDGL